ncbi:MAG: ribosomal L7Ae/L30e/S12e/Gadd45 family protein [Clostridia bacterium]|nr:ribosomal L7Ae/L30e/S12e/Gadd45 family protein [Clostridia bacterium]
MITTEEKSNLIVGYKQVLRALNAKTCQKLFLAEDCSENIAENLKKAACGTPIVSVSTMRELGNMCEIDVPASCAAVIRL